MDEAKIIVALGGLWLGSAAWCVRYFVARIDQCDDELNDLKTRVAVVESKQGGR